MMSSPCLTYPLHDAPTVLICVIAAYRFMLPTQALLIRHQYALTPYFAASPRVLSPFSAQTHDTFVDVPDGGHATEDTPSLSNSDPIPCCRYLAVLFAPCCRSILPTCGLGMSHGILCLLVPQIRPPPNTPTSYWSPHTDTISCHSHSPPRSLHFSLCLFHVRSVQQTYRVTVRWAFSSCVATLQLPGTSRGNLLVPRRLLLSFPHLPTNMFALDAATHPPSSH